MENQTAVPADVGRSVMKHMRALLLLIAATAIAASTAAQNPESDAEYTFVFTKSKGRLARVWALPADTGVADSVPGLWADIGGQRSYVLPINCGFYAETLTLRQLAERQGLLALDLSTQDIRDSELEHLGRSSNLRELVLDHTSISDEGLQFLRKVSTLRKLNIYRTAVTTSGITQLALANAKLEINHSRRGTIGFSPDRTEPSDAPKYRWPVFTNGYSTPGTR